MRNGRWSVKASKYILKTPWVNIRADDCITVSGVSVSPYYLLELPDFVHVLAFTQDECIVFVKQYRHGLNDVSIELPGGYMDQNDASPAATAARELREETGFSSKSLNHLITLSIDPARYTNKVHFFCAYDLAAGRTDLDLSENIELLLVPRDEALKLASTGGIVDAAHAAAVLIGLSSVGSPPFG